jgi:hypothetical protein
MNINNLPMRLNGLRVVISKPVKCEIKIKRTWKERLFTCPFKPFTKTKISYELKETLIDGQVLNMGDHLIMTAKTWHACEIVMNEEMNHQ